MVNIKIKDAKPIKVGNSHYFTIPAQYMHNGLIEKDKSYTLGIEEKN